MAKEGSTIAGLMDTFATAISLALQHGVPLRLLSTSSRARASSRRASPATRRSRAPRSIMDYLFRWLGAKFVEGGRVEHAEASTPRADRRVDARIQPPSPRSIADAAQQRADGRRRSTPQATRATATPTTATATATATAARQRQRATFSFIARTDAPTCPECGSIMIPNGSCHKCINCGTTSGCS